MKALTVANYILSLGVRGNRPTISNLKLQKLLYYCQGAHLALLDKPLFADPIVAWPHGPVVEDVYHCYKNYGSRSITSLVSVPDDELTPNMCMLIQWVFAQCAQYAVWQLRNMTHEEAPWLQTEPQAEMSQGLMKQFFKQRIKKLPASELQNSESPGQAFLSGVGLFLDGFANALSFGILSQKDD